MSSILTLVASDDKYPVTKKHLKEIKKIVDFYNVSVTGSPDWLKANIAVDIVLSEKPQSSLMSHFRDFFVDDKIDVFTTKPGNRKKKLLLADMDSTIVAEETLDELAAYAGIKDEIAQITTQAMNGQLDFHEALKKRVALLKGLSADKLQETLDQTIINKGAKDLVQTMKDNGCTCVLVSGGFTFFTSAIATELGFDFNHGNKLDIKDGLLTGNVIDPIQDKHSKLSYLRQYSADLGLDESDILAIGDGANDLPMLKTADLGIGYYPKDTVSKEIDNLIVHGSLSAALYAQGYKF